MKKLTTLLFTLTWFCNCSNKNETIGFITLNENEFNSKPFELPAGHIPGSAKKSHDSCMGFSFDANAILIQTKDTFFIGSVVNRQSLQIVSTLKDFGLTQKQLFSQFNIIGEPCYEKRVLHFPPGFTLGQNIALQLPGADDATNKEINDALLTSGIAEIESGPWVYMDMKDALKNILDTTKTAPGLAYKKNVLDSANMVLTSLEAVTYLTFIIHTKKNLSGSLQAILKNKPFVSVQNTKFTTRLFYIDDNKFQMSLNGFFPAAGEFMRAVSK